MGWHLQVGLKIEAVAMNDAGRLATRIHLTFSGVDMFVWRGGSSIHFLMVWNAGGCGDVINDSLRLSKLVSCFSGSIKSIIGKNGASPFFPLPRPCILPLTI